jgi:hypothetical protein
MKHILIYMMVLVGLLLTSCDIETSNNGDLDGFWQLQSVDTLSNKASADMKSQGVYWGVQKDLVEVRKYKGDSYNVYFKFDYSGNSLRLYSPYKDDRDEQDKAITDITLLRPLGVNALDESFTIEQLDDKLVMSSSSLRLHFRRY